MISFRVLLLVAALGCGSTPVDAPPELRLGESVCAECGMIVSDERFATATIVAGDRGPEPRMFDDFNCQINFERDDPAPEVVTRWVHDHASLIWLPAVAAHYIRSSTLHTPMASGVAAFESPKAAAQFADSLEGEVVTFQELWRGETVLAQ